MLRNPSEHSRRLTVVAPTTTTSIQDGSSASTLHHIHFKVISKCNGTAECPGNTPKPRACVTRLPDNRYLFPTTYVLFLKGLMQSCLLRCPISLEGNIMVDCKHAHWLLNLGGSSRPQWPHGPPGTSPAFVSFRLSSYPRQNQHSNVYFVLLLYLQLTCAYAHPLKPPMPLEFHKNHNNHAGGPGTNP
ncbi:hypothetical protein CYLTODRAFT_14044 [Cylindrobasidium torrendii FP15055 ss-10]|uniref:Uncharacterized protein n=1 Tax=Cylindrobasidium torrendii FP15055 ss-10 TaxID=1314674 RepID=A0A0D7BAB8_9AGAR|nr:hypothetical protein CYLTODRAFT_14044 [Cylindrobasidium torrendii FP15055 ss-10]